MTSITNCCRLYSWSSVLQALAKGNTTKAVKCLRMELAPLQVDTVQLHVLANAVMCQDEDDLQKVMDWAGPDNGSRQHLLNSLQVCNVHILLAASLHPGAARLHACCCFRYRQLLSSAKDFIQLRGNLLNSRPLSSWSSDLSIKHLTPRDVHGRRWYQLI